MSNYQFGGKTYSVYGSGEIARYNSLVELFYRSYADLQDKVKEGYNYYGNKYDRELGHKLEKYVNEYSQNAFYGNLKGVTDPSERKMITNMYVVYMQFNDPSLYPASPKPKVLCRDPSGQWYNLYNCPKGYIYDAYDGCCHLK